MAYKPLCTFRIFIYISVGLHPRRDQKVASIHASLSPSVCPKQTSCLFVIVVWFFLALCMNIIIHILVNHPPIKFSFSHPRLPLISHIFSISPPFSLHSLSPSFAANPLLLPPLHPLLPEGFEKVLHNALQIITMHAL